MTTTFPSAAPASVLHSLNRVSSELDALLAGLRPYSESDGALRRVAQTLAEAVARAPDVAIACILLNQIGGRYSVRHCVDTAILACVLARAMGEAPAAVLTVAAAALTMNVGMMRQIETLQNKATLSGDERALVHRHPSESAQLLRSAGVGDEEWLSYVLQHHENDDGSGYPDGRREGDIAFNAKLIRMADRYCACVSARNYRRSMLPPLALGTLDADAGNDPVLTKLFAQQLGPFPPGTLVRLANGDIGAVAGRSADRVLLVHALRGADGAKLSQLRRIDQADFAIETALHEDEAQLRFSMTAVWGAVAAL
ncbi:MAG: HD domain-containing phosphohydrolase [Pseudomonadota bacterium]|nr:HD domain-containing phosphohydrolase [Pseudomonadota bacterium]